MVTVNTPTAGVSTGSSKETVFLVGGIILILGIVVFILWKSGIFKVTNTAANIVDKAGKVIGDITNLPQNAVTLITSVPAVVQSATQQIQSSLGLPVSGVAQLDKTACDNAFAKVGLTTAKVQAIQKDYGAPYYASLQTAIISGTLSQAQVSVLNKYGWNSSIYKSSTVLFQ